MKDINALVQEYADARAAAARHDALLECLVDDKDGFLAAKIAQYEAAAVIAHVRLVNTLDLSARLTVHAVPDPRMPVPTVRDGMIEARAVTPDTGRRVRIRYTATQALTTGTALIASALTGSGDSLTRSRPASPTDASSGEAAGLPGSLGHGRYLSSYRLVTALEDVESLDPLLSGVLRELSPRVYPSPPDSAMTDHVVLDLHGVSIGVQRRPDALYLHIDTSETDDTMIAVEINGGGEHQTPTGYEAPR